MIPDDSFDYAPPRCIGGCGDLVKAPGQICAQCDLPMVPIQPPPEASWDRIRLDLYIAATRLAFGNQAEQEEAIETISHLVTVLTQYNMKEGK